MRPADILAKAERALASAKALLEIGDDDGAANRAYYAMFDAARAALMETQAADFVSWTLPFPYCISPVPTPPFLRRKGSGSCSGMAGSPRSCSIR